MVQTQYNQMRASMMTTFISTIVAILVAVPIALYVANKLIQSSIASAATQSAVVNQNPAPYAVAGGTGCTDATAQAATAAAQPASASASPAGASSYGGGLWGGYVASSSVNQTQTETHTTNSDNRSYVMTVQDSYKVNTNNDNSVTTGDVMSNNNVNSTVVEDNEVDIEDSFYEDNSVEQTALGLLAGNINVQP